MLKYTLLMIYLAAVAGTKATVIYSYDADQDDELSLTVGDVIHVIDQVLLLTCTCLVIFLLTYLPLMYCCLCGLAMS